MNILRGRVDRHFIAIAVIAILIELIIFASIAWLIAAYGGSIWNILSDRGGNEYATLARSMMVDGQFILADDIPETFRTPGYPTLLALLFTFFVDSYVAVALLHIVFVGLTAALIAHIVYTSGLPRIYAYIAALLYTVSSGTIFAIVTGQGSDITYTLLHVLTAAVILQYVLTRQNGNLVAISIGVILGIATYVRPVGLLGSLPLIVALAFVPIYERPSVLSRIKIAAIAVLCFVLTITPWCVRNYRATGEVLFSSLPTYNFVYYNIPLFYSFWSGAPENTTRDELLSTLNNTPMNSIRNASYSDHLNSIVKEFMYTNALPYLLFHSLKTFPFFVGSGLHNLHNGIISEAPLLRLSIFPTDQFNITSEILNRNWIGIINILQQFWVVTIDRLFWFLAFILAFISPFFVRGIAHRFLIAIILLILTNAFLASPVAQPRYRIPAEPFMWIAVVYSAWGLRKWRADQTHSTLQP